MQCDTALQHGCVGKRRGARHNGDVSAVPSLEPDPADVAAMRLALAEAALAQEHDDVPVGAVVVDAGGVVLGAGHNERELTQDPTAHAEILALRRAAAAVGSWRVLESTLVVTLEPCAMCAGAIVLARVPRVVYGATDPKAGAAGSVLDLLDTPQLNHRPSVVGGVLREDCAELLRAFFRARRGV
ncbi:MAG: CMP/dCMP deaminase zinc-binding protein [Solirubrobacterales bacterium]|nr:CMP/dCMP deaminase zinc-binding protein [Solirubrobacterales bacterium]